MSTVSVLLPAYNAEATIGAAILSVQDADQIVIVDDASTDRTVALASSCMKFAPVEVTSLRFHGGVTAALRLGLEHCRGDYIARQDADDFSAQNRLHVQREYLATHSGTVLVASRARILTGTTSRLGCKLRWAPKLQLRFRNPIIHGSVMFRREAVLQVGGYREPFGLAQDLDLWLRLKKVGKFHILPDVLYFLRRHPQQVSLSRRSEQRAYAALARWAA